MEQPYAESFIYNSIRKTIDYGQLEFLKSGNRQPVPVTTRYWSPWRRSLSSLRPPTTTASPICSARSTGSPACSAKASPSGSPTRAMPMYLNTTVEDLLRMAGHEAAKGNVASTASTPQPRPSCLRKKPSTKPCSRPRSTSPSRSSTNQCARATRICNWSRINRQRPGEHPLNRPFHFYLNLSYAIHV